MIFFKLRNENRKSLNRVVLLVISNAVVGLILKSFLIVRPIFTIYYQLRYIFGEYKFQDLLYVRTCQDDYACSTIDTMGRDFMLVNLTIQFFFFYKFDSRFNECLRNLIKILKKKISKNLQK